MDRTKFVTKMLVNLTKAMMSKKGKGVKKNTKRNISVPEIEKYYCIDLVVHSSTKWFYLSYTVLVTVLLSHSLLTIFAQIPSMLWVSHWGVCVEYSGITCLLYSQVSQQMNQTSR